jgi:hypothetical protein
MKGSRISVAADDAPGRAVVRGALRAAVAARAAGLDGREPVLRLTRQVATKPVAISTNVVTTITAVVEFTGLAQVMADVLRKETLHRGGMAEKTALCAPSARMHARELAPWIAGMLCQAATNAAVPAY